MSGLVGWYAVWGVRYLGPFAKKEAAEQAGTAKFADKAGKREGSVEYLDGSRKRPTYGLLGPLTPRYR
jgi:hypothetical protein